MFEETITSSSSPNNRIKRKTARLFTTLFMGASLFSRPIFHSEYNWCWGSSCKDLPLHQAKTPLCSDDNSNPHPANTQPIPPITLTYLRDINIYLHLWFTLHKMKLMARHHDVIEATGGVWWSFHSACFSCLIRGPYSRGQWEQLKSLRGGALSNGPSKGHSNDIVRITELIVKHLHCRRFTAAP